jgi:hypothetical protein
MEHFLNLSISHAASKSTAVNSHPKLPAKFILFQYNNMKTRMISPVDDGKRVEL